MDIEQLNTVVSENVKFLMDRENLNITTVSDASGVSLGQVSDALTGRKASSLNVLLKLSEYFGLQPMELTDPLMRHRIENGGDGPKTPEKIQKFCDDLVSGNLSVLKARALAKLIGCNVSELLD